MNRKSRLISAGCLLAAIFSCWYLLNPANARWLKIERSPVAVPGQNFKVRVILTKADPGLYLGADLHGITSDGLSTGYLCGARQVKVTAGTNVYEFSIPVPMNKKIFYLFPVIILSRDGTWQGRILTAHGETVTLCPHCSPDQYIKPEPAAAHETEYRAAEKKSASRATGIATALAWIIAAITAAFPGKVKVSRAITAVALVSFLWEVLNSSFHEALLAGHDSPWTLRLLRTLGRQSERYRRYAISLPESRRDVHAEHREIYDSAMVGNELRAALALEAHIRTTPDLLAQALRSGRLVLPGGSDDASAGA